MNSTPAAIDPFAVGAPEAEVGALRRQPWHWRVI